MCQFPPLNPELWFGGLGPLPLIASMWTMGPQHLTWPAGRKQWTSPRRNLASEIHEGWHEKLENHHVSKACVSLISFVPGLGNRIEQWRTDTCLTHWEWATRKMTTKGNLLLYFVNTEWKIFNGILYNSFISLNKFITSFNFVPGMDISRHRQLLIET